MKRLFKDKVCYIVFILFFFKPVCLQYYSSLSGVESLFVYGKILISIAVIICYFINKSAVFPKIFINKYLFCIFLFEVYMLFVTIFTHGDIFRSCIDLISVFVLTLFVYHEIKKNPYDLIINLYNVFLFLVCMQFLSSIIFRDGMPADLYTNNEYNKLFFATIDNGTTELTVICVALVFLKDSLSKKKNRYKLERIAVNTLCVFTTISVHSVTAIICTCILILSIWLAKYIMSHKQKKRRFWILLYIVIFVLMLYFSKGGDAFTGRALIWERALDMIKVNFFIGYGKQPLDLVSIWGSYYSSHNTILQILLEGGIIGLSLWMICLGICLKTLKEICNNSVKTILFFTLYIFLISLLMESNIHSQYLFLILAVISGLPYAIDKNDVYLRLL